MLDGLTNEIYRLLAGDAYTLDDAGLLDVVIGLHREASRLSAATARFTSVWEARKAWGKDGSRSAAARLQRETKVAPHRAKAEVRRARALRHMPLVRAAFEAGELTAEHVDVLARANPRPLHKQFVAAEATMIGWATTLCFEDFVHMVANWREAADNAAGRDRAARRHADRRLELVPTVFGSFDIRGHGPALEGMIIKTENDRLEQILFEHDLAEAKAIHGDDITLEQLARTPAQRRWDAQVEMARRSAALDPNAKATRPLLSVLVGYDQFKIACELERTATVVNPTEIARLLHDTDIDVQRIVFGPASKILDVGVRTRLFKGALRRGIQVRDRHCTHPSGCPVPADQCDIDHIIEYEDGGETTQDNGELHCRFHNNWKHRHKNRPPPTDAA